MFPNPGLLKVGGFLEIAGFAIEGCGWFEPVPTDFPDIRAILSFIDRFDVSTGIVGLKSNLVFSPAMPLGCGEMLRLGERGESLGLL